MKLNRFAILLFAVIGLVAPTFAQENAKNTGSQPAPVTRVSAGQKTKITGVIVKRSADTFTIRNLSDEYLMVTLTNFTKVEEKKSNPFRRAKNYNTTLLMRGLAVEVEGRGNNDGALVADKIKMREESLFAARNVETRVAPVEGRVDEAETRITQTEANAKRLSGQLQELAEISNAARGGAKAAQETADTALARVEETNRRVDKVENLISSLDDYEAKRGITVNFRVRRYDLSPEAKLALDEIATQAKAERGYVIEVMGFASADGDENLNRRLSQQRADAVVRYLAENHMVPLRRIITPFGYGESQPVGDNTSREGREQNRRVEVKILVNRALTAPRSAVTSETPARTRETTTTRVP